MCNQIHIFFLSSYHIHIYSYLLLTTICLPIYQSISRRTEPGTRSLSCSLNKCCTAWLCTALSFAAVHSTALHSTVLHSAAVHNAALHSPFCTATTCLLPASLASLLAVAGRWAISFFLRKKSRASSSSASSCYCWFDRDGSSFACCSFCVISVANRRGSHERGPATCSQNWTTACWTVLLSVRFSTDIEEEEEE